MLLSMDLLHDTGPHNCPVSSLLQSDASGGWCGDSVLLNVHIIMESSRVVNWQLTTPGSKAWRGLIAESVPVTLDSTLLSLVLIFQQYLIVISPVFPVLSQSGPWWPVCWCGVSDPRAESPVSSQSLVTITRRERAGYSVSDTVLLTIARDQHTHVSLPDLYFVSRVSRVSHHPTPPTQPEKTVGEDRAGSSGEHILAAVSQAQAYHSNTKYIGEQSVRSQCYRQAGHQHVSQNEKTKEPNNPELFTAYRCEDSDRLQQTQPQPKRLYQQQQNPPSLYQRHLPALCQPRCQVISLHEGEYIY